MGSVPLEILYRALVFLRGLPGLEGPQISPLPGLGILLSGVQPILAVGQLSDHLGSCENIGAQAMDDSPVT
jgi:hypothetical protein